MNTASSTIDKSLLALLSYKFFSTHLMIHLTLKLYYQFNAPFINDSKTFPSRAEDS